MVFAYLAGVLMLIVGMGTLVSLWEYEKAPRFG